MSRIVLDSCHIVINKETQMNKKRMNKKPLKNGNKWNQNRVIKIDKYVKLMIMIEIYENDKYLKYLKFEQINYRLFSPLMSCYRPILTYLYILSLMKNSRNQIGLQLIAPWVSEKEPTLIQLDTNISIFIDSVSKFYHVPSSISFPL